MVAKTRLGATGSSVTDMGNMGALTPILGQLAGGTKRGQMAIDFAQQLYPEVEKADPYEAALQYFLEMGRQASQPGATVLGSAVGAMQAPADYLAAKKKEKRETDRARMQTALQLAPSLKPKPVAGKTTYRPATAKELEQYGATAGQMGSDGKFYDLSKTPTSSGSTTTVSVNPDNLETLKTFLGLPNLMPDENNNIVLSNANAIKAANQGLVGTKQSAPTSQTSALTNYKFANAQAVEKFKTKYPDIVLTPEQEAGNQPIGLPNSISNDPDLLNVFVRDVPESEKSDPYIDIIDTTITDDPATPRNEQRTSIKESEFDNSKHIRQSAIPETELDLKDQIQVSRDIRTEYSKKAEQLNEAERNYNTLLASAEAASGPGDVALVTAFMKMLDPGSVVRETEFANARDTAGLREQLLNNLQKLETGAFLQDTQREEFVDLARQYLFAGRNRVTNLRRTYGTIVQEYGLNPITVFGGEIATPQAYMNRDLIKIAIDNNTTINALWAVMTDEEKEEYGG